MAVGDKILRPMYDVWRGLLEQADGSHAEIISTLHPTALSTYATGERAGSVAAVQLATVAAKYVRLKARAGNVGAVWVGNANTVTKGAGTTTTTCGFPLNPGDDSGWLPATNLNLFYVICDNAADHLTYMIAN